MKLEVVLHFHTHTHTHTHEHTHTHTFTITYTHTHKHTSAHTKLNNKAPKEFSRRSNFLRRNVKPITWLKQNTIFLIKNTFLTFTFNGIRGRPYLTSRNLGQFFYTPSPHRHAFLSVVLALSSQNHWTIEPSPSLRQWRHLWTTHN